MVVLWVLVLLILLPSRLIWTPPKGGHSPSGCSLRRKEAIRLLCTETACVHPSTAHTK